MFSTQDLLTHIDLQNTFGALFIGASLAATLFGVNNVQAFIYFQKHRGTGIISYKSIVIALCALNALHLAVMVHCVYYYLVTNYTDVSALTGIVWSFNLQVLLGVIVIYVVHVLYAYRIWTAGKGQSRILPITVGIIVVLVSGGISIGTLWALYRCDVFSDLVQIKPMTFIASGTFALVDWVIILSLYYLATFRTGFSSTDSLVSKLTNNAIHNGCLMSLFSMATLITCVVMPTNFVFLGIEFLMTNIYIFSFLALLNAQSKPQHKRQSKQDAAEHAELRVRHTVYPAQLHRESRDDESLAPRKDIFIHHEDENLGHTCPTKVSCNGFPSA